VPIRRVLANTLMIECDFCGTDVQLSTGDYVLAFDELRRVGGWYVSIVGSKTRFRCSRCGWAPTYVLLSPEQMSKANKP
jgi:hypothetical protein